MRGLIKFTIGLMLAGFIVANNAEHTQIILIGTIAGMMMGYGIREWIAEALK